MTAQGMYNRFKYKRIFGLCMILGATDIYDIGCGGDLQVGYISQYRGISYTGIDSREDLEIEKYNDLFESYNPDICFKRMKYPCTFEVKTQDHMVILVGWYLNDPEKTIEALVRDFSRIYIQIPDEHLELTKRILKKHQVMEVEHIIIDNFFPGKKVGGYTFLLVTRFPEDIRYLMDIGYDCHNERFHLGNRSLSDYLERFRDNISKKLGDKNQEYNQVIQDSCKCLSNSGE